MPIEPDVVVYKLASGDVSIWVEPGGAICLKVKGAGDPLDLAEHEAIEIGELLIRLAKE